MKQMRLGERGKQKGLTARERWAFGIGVGDPGAPVYCVPETGGRRGKIRVSKEWVGRQGWGAERWEAVGRQQVRESGDWLVYWEHPDTRAAFGLPGSLEWYRRREAAREAAREAGKAQ